MKNNTKFNIITKILIIFFGLETIFSPIIRIVISGTAINPDGTFWYQFIFGILSFPSEILLEHGGSYNVPLYVTFVIIFVIGYLLNFGYFKKEKISKLRSKLDLVSVILMLLGLFGCIVSAIETTEMDMSNFGTIKSRSKMNLISAGFYFGIITISLILIEYIILEKSNLLIDKIPTKVKTTPLQMQTITEGFKYCNQCGEKIKNRSQFCSLCGQKQ